MDPLDLYIKYMIKNTKQFIGFQWTCLLLLLFTIVQFEERKISCNDDETYFCYTLL